MLLRSALPPFSVLALAITGCAAGDQPEPTTSGAGGTGGAAGSGGTTDVGGAGPGGGTNAGGAGGASSSGGAGGTSSSSGGAGGTSSSGGSGGSGAGGEGPCGAAQCTGDLEWVKRYGPVAGQQFAYGMSVDGVGQATIAGGFNATIDFGGGMQLATAGGIDMYWAKVSPAGVTVAAKSFGGAGNDLATGAAVDRKGNTAFYGVFSGTLDFGNGPLEAQNFRIFLARLAPDGTSVWSKAFGEQVGASSQAAAFDPQGNVLYAAGYFGDIDFGAGPVTGGSTSLTVTKFNGTGEALWSKKLTTYMSSAAAGDGNGGMLVAGGGDMANPPDIGCGDPGAFRLLGRLDGNGSCLWHKPVVGAAIDFVAAEGDVFAVLGRFNGSATIGNDVLSAPGGKRFVASFDKDGTLRWSFVIADDSVDLGALAVDTNGGVVFKGSLLNGTANFNGNVLDGNSALVRLGPDGAWLWGKGFTGDASTPVSVDVAPLGHVYLYGRADGPIDFGSGLIAGGAYPVEDAVLARFKP